MSHNQEEKDENSVLQSTLSNIGIYQNATLLSKFNDVNLKRFYLKILWLILVSDILTQESTFDVKKVNVEV